MNFIENCSTIYHQIDIRKWSQQLDVNKRLDPLLQIAKSDGYQHVQRFAHLVFPFLNLYQPAQVGISIALGGMQVWTLSAQLIKSSREHEWKRAMWQVGCLALVINQVALSILMPVTGVVLSSVMQIAYSVYALGCDLKKGHYKQATWQLAHIVHQLIYLASAVYATPEYLFLSLLTQGCVELYHSYQEWSKRGHLPESLASLLMALLRFYQASAHGQTLHRNYFGHQIEQDDLKVVVAAIRQQKEENPEALVDFEKILKKHYYSSKIRHISFEGEATDLSHIFFKNIAFQNCQFLGADLSHSVFQHVTAKNCQFARIWAPNAVFKHFRAEQCQFAYTNFYESSFHHTSFQNCHLYEMNMAGTTLEKVQFKNSKLPYTSLNNARLDQVAFKDCNLKEACFFDAEIKNSSLKDCDLTDCLLLDTQEHFKIEGGKPLQLTRPVIGLLWNFEGQGTYTKLIHEALKDSGALVFRVDYKLKGLDPNSLTQEVKEGIEKVTQEGLKAHQLSIADALIQDCAGKEFDRIRQQSSKAARYMQGLLLPGGDDVEPEFYKQTKGVLGDYERSVFEFGLISQALKKEMPLQGICRGSQIVNVFMGGTLKEHVDNHSVVVHSLTIKDDCPKDAAAIMQKILGGSQIQGLSMHHQACEQIGKGLSVVLEQEGSPEALVSQNGKIVLTQFHPEIYFAFKGWKPEKEKEIEKKESKDFFTMLLAADFSKGQNFFHHLIQQVNSSCIQNVEVAYA